MERLEISKKDIQPAELPFGTEKNLKQFLFCVPHNDCRWLDEAGCAEKRGS